MFDRGFDDRLQCVMSNEISIQPVSTKSDLKKFIRFPWRIYRGATPNPSWVPPLLFDENDTHNTKHNPFYDHADIQRFIAYRDGVPVGRIGVAIDHDYNTYYSSKTGFFGFLEVEDDATVAATLMETAEAWLVDHGMDHVIGPMNPSSNHVLGLLVDDFDNPAKVMMPYNPSYYEALVTGCGYRPVKDLYAYRMDATKPLSDKMLRVSKIVEKKTGVVIRPVDMKNLKSEVQVIREIYNDAWRGNWGFVPWTEDDMAHMVPTFKLICIPDLVIMAYVDGEPVGFSMGIPNINQALIKMNGRLFPFGFIKFFYLKRRVDQLRVAVLGVKKKYQGMGLDSLFFVHTYNNGVRHGMKEGEFSWILEDNRGVRDLLEHWGVGRYRTYRLYEKELG